MADRVRLTMFFEQGKYGWTETFYLPNSTLSDALTKGFILRERRRNLLGANATIKALRVSDDAFFRDSLLQTVPSDLGNGLLTWGNSDPAFTALLWRLEGGERHRRQLYMRGVPDEVIQIPDPPVFRPAYQKVLDAYILEIKTGAWAFKIIQVPPTVPAIAVANFVNSDPPVVTTGVNHGYATGDNVLIRGVVGFETGAGRNANGRWYVNVLTVQSFEIKGRPIPVGSYLSGGTCVKRVYGLVDISNAEVVRIAKRSTGRPFDSPVGRRRKAR